ncbi:MAG: alpha/beta hydrolase family protein, partial [Phycisphaerales bacterium]
MPDFAAKLPASLAARTRDVRLVGDSVPALLVDPIREGEAAPPLLLWMHGRTVDRFLDPGRYLRLMRAGIGVCAIDLPGHGDRFDPAMQRPEAMPRIVRQAFDEVDRVLEEAIELGGFDPRRVAIGGMSAGGMISLARLASPSKPPRFAAAVVEGTTGSWRTLPWWPLAESIADLEPAQHASTWSPVPLLGLHNRFDEWVPLRSKQAFFEAIRPRYAPPAG